VVAALVEGNSIRATVRMTGIAKNTIVKLLVDLGAACSDYQDRTLRNLSCKRIECDEIWSFVGARQKNVPPETQRQLSIGDVWTWTAICADSKLVPSWAVGDRGGATAHAFINDLADRFSNRMQLTTDGHKVYLAAIDSAFGIEIDCAMLIKKYGADNRPNDAATRPLSARASRRT
jgi:IS1 family transposase